MPTSIEWTRGDDGSPGETWNPIKARLREPVEIQTLAGTKIIPAGKVGFHCEKVSPACKFCYAESGNRRTLPAWGTGLGYTVPNREKVEIFLDEKALLEPLHWKKPRRIFPCSMTDWCAEFVPDEFRDRMMAVAALTPRHTYQFLTKRAEGMHRYFTEEESPYFYPCTRVEKEARRVASGRGMNQGDVEDDWPLPNVWLGVSVESRDCLSRIDHLRQTSAAVRFLSIEPLLEDLGDISGYLRGADEESLECSECPWRGDEEDARCVDDPPEDWWFACPKCGGTCAHVPLDELRPGIDWVICGGESGRGSRPMPPEWVRSIRDQCSVAGIPFFFKQWGSHSPIPSDSRQANHCPALNVPVGDGTHHRMFRFANKHNAGRLLDGRTWDQMPHPTRT